MRRIFGRALWTMFGVVMSAVAIGCHDSPTAAEFAQPAPQQLIPVESESGLADPESFAPVEAVVVPPIGWRAEPLKASERHNHQVWLSPSGNTAYGVIRFNLPLPLGPDMVLRHGFLPEMKKSEGEARLLSSEKDPQLPGLRFVAEGGLYRLRTNLITRGWKGWAVYAGTLRDHEVVADELALAEFAREQTKVGVKVQRQHDSD